MNNRDSTRWPRQPMLPVVLALGVLVGCEQERQPTATETTQTTGAHGTDAVTPDSAVVVTADPAEQPAPDQADRTTQATLTNAGGVGGPVTVQIRTPQQIRAGEQYTYELVVKNASSTPVLGVTLRESLPEQMTISGEHSRIAGVDAAALRAQGQPRRRGDEVALAQQQQPGNQQKQTEQLIAVHEVGTLGPGEAKTIRVQAVARSEGQLQQCVAVDYLPVFCSMAQVVKPQLDIVQRIDNPYFFVCDEVVATYVVSNPGTGATKPATLTVQIPEGLATSDGQRQVTLDLGAINAGQKVEKAVTLKAQKAGSFEIRGVAQTGELSVQSDVAQLEAYQPQLAVDVRGPQQTYLNRTIQHRVIVQNPSDAPAYDTVVKLDLPDGADRVTSSAERFDAEKAIIDLGRLDAGQSREFVVSFDVHSPGEVQTRAVANAYCVQAQTKQVATVVRGIPAVGIEMVDSRDPVMVGETTIYEVRVNNEGSAPGLNVQLEGQIPENMRFVSGGGETRVQARGQTIQFERVPELQPGGVAVWRIEVRGESEGQSRFQVRLMTEAQQREVVEQEPTNVVASR